MKQNNILTLLLSLILYSCSHQTEQVKREAALKPEPTVFPLGVIDSISSNELGEMRTLNIYLPEDFRFDSTAFKQYPVIFLLDGSANEDFIHTAGVVQFMNMIGKLHKVILVGISNVDRKRDFTFPTTIEQDKLDFPTTGKSAKFISFLANELKPFIASKYGGSGHSTLIGQSLGGLLATEILFKQPCLFDDYLIVSPSLWWDNESLFQYADGIRKNSNCAERGVYLTVGAEGEEMEKPTAKLAALLDSIPDENLHLKYFPLHEENHLTILHHAIYKMIDLRYADLVE